MLVTRMASSKIDQLIQDFATDLRAAIAEEAAAAFAEIAGAGARTIFRPRTPGRPAKATSPGKGGERVRRSADDIAQQAALILGYIKKNPGHRAEQIGSAVGFSTREMMVPIAKLLEEKKLGKKGVKRATSYTAK